MHTSLHSKAARNAPHDRQIELADVAQDKLDHLLVLFLADPANKRLRGQLYAQPVGNQAVLRKAIVEAVNRWQSPRAWLSVRGSCLPLQRALTGWKALHLQLVGDLGQVAAAHKANRTVLLHLAQQLHHGRLYRLTGGRERLVDVKETQDIGVRPVRKEGGHGVAGVERQRRAGAREAGRG